MLALPMRSRRWSRRIESWRSRLALAAALGGAVSLSVVALPVAQACGCLVINDVSVPTVQAGERILFAPDNGMVTAIIQIQYQGKPGDFGWLVPLPSIPKNRAGQDGIDVSTDEVFTKLLATTGPSYAVTPVYTCTQQYGYGGDYGGNGCSSGGLGCNSDSLAGAAYYAADAGQSAMTAAPSPLVLQSSVGPYDFAVLKADSQADMLKWLQDNRYVVPTGSDTAVTPYIRPGAYFLALKLQANAASGSVQPVVLRYQSDYPMIPVSLTSVGAVRDMGIQVWVLGKSRAIPRNYYHAVLNDAQLDLLNSVVNYSAVVTKAVAEAPGKHAFITEYAASSGVMVGLLDSPGRFSGVAALASQNNAYRYVELVMAPGSSFVPPSSFGPGGPAAQALLPDASFAAATVLSQYIPEPQPLVERGVSLVDYFQNLAYYLTEDPQRGGPDYDATVQKMQQFDATVVTADLQNRIVMPTLQAAALFETQPMLTRLYTTLSPEDMNLDPVFGYNADLPEVPLAHTSTFTQGCEQLDTTLDTDSGLHVSAWKPDNPALPYSLRIETLGETGGPQIIADHQSQIRSLAPFDSKSGASVASADLQRGCTTTPSRRVPVAGPLSLFAIVGGLILARRRRRVV